MSLSGPKGVDSFCGGLGGGFFSDVEFDREETILGGHTNSSDFFNLTANSMDYFVFKVGNNPMDNSTGGGTQIFEFRIICLRICRL